VVEDTKQEREKTMIEAFESHFYMDMGEIQARYRHDNSGDLSLLQPQNSTTEVGSRYTVNISAVLCHSGRCDRSVVIII
jgi:hypothetical protein